MGVNVYYVDFDAAGPGVGSFENPWNNSQDAYDNAVTDGSHPAYVWYRGGKTEEPTGTILVGTNSGDDATNRIYHIADRFGEKWSDSTGEVTIKPTSAIGTNYILDSDQNYITIRGFDFWIYAAGLNIDNGSTAYGDKDVILEECIVRDNRANVDGAMAGMYIPYIGSATIRNCIICNLSNTHANGYVWGIWLRRNGPSAVNIYNNTIYNIYAVRNLYLTGGIFIYHYDAGSNTQANANIKNNIIQKIYDDGNQYAGCIGIYEEQETGDWHSSNIDMDYNHYYLDSGTNYATDRDGVPHEYPVFADWQAFEDSGSVAMGWDANSTAGTDPLFEGTGSVRTDYKIRGTSPCRNTGIYIASVINDMYQRPRGPNGYDKGAYQYGVATII